MSCVHRLHTFLLVITGDDSVSYLSPLSPGLLGAEHLGPDEVRVDRLLPGVGGADLQHEGVAGSPRQRGQALDGTPRLQGKVGAVEFGQGLLDQRHP